MTVHWVLVFSVAYRSLPASSHDHFAGLAPIPLDREVEINGIGGILTNDRKQHADSADKRVGKSELNGRLDTDDGRPVDGSTIDCVTVSPPSDRTDSHEFEVVGQTFLVVEEMLEDQSRVDGVTDINVLAGITPRC